jgi:hypothetical protein
LQGSACTGSIATNAQGIGCWLDRSGAAANAAQSTAGYRPLVSAAGINGRRAVQFTLANESWLSVTASAIRTLRSANRTVFVAATSNATANNSDNSCSGLVVWPGFHSGILTCGFPAVDAVGSDHFAQLGGGTQGRAYVSLPAAGSPFVVATTLQFLSSTNLSTSVVLNGSANNTTAFSDPSPSGVTDLIIGQGNTAPAIPFRYRLDGRIGEVLVFSRVLTTTERQQVERYLGWKWGVTIP